MGGDTDPEAGSGRRTKDTMKIKDIMQKGTLRRRLLPAIAGAVVIALAAGGVAYATTPSSSSTPSSVAATSHSQETPATVDGLPVASGEHPFRQDLRWLFRHTVHAQFIVRTASGYRVLEFDRGQLSSVSASSITIVRLDGPSVTAALTPTTKYLGLSESELAKGDLVALVQDGHGDALLVASRAPKTTTPSPGSGGSSTGSSKAS